METTRKMTRAEKVAAVRTFFAHVRHSGETVEEWAARVTVEAFRSEHQSLWDQGICV